MPNISENAAIRKPSALFHVSIAYIAISYAMSIIALVLNLIEIRFIVKVWKAVTDFELLLFNLAIADVLSSISFSILTGLAHYIYKSKAAYSIKSTHMYWVVTFHTHFVLASTSFVIIIGLERFFATKLPLKHRLWHTGKQRMLKCVSFTWCIDILITALSFSIDYAINKTEFTLASKSLSYWLASLLAFALTFLLILYVWLARLILIRSIKLFDFDKKELSINAKMIHRAMKKELATIKVCVLVLVCLIVSDLPLIIDFYMQRVTKVTTLLMKFNSVANPIIYFFKGYLERHYSRKNLKPLPDPRAIKNFENSKEVSVATVFSNERGPMENVKEDRSNEKGQMRKVK